MEELELRQYLRIARKWWWLVVVSTLVAAGFGFQVSEMLPPIYRASTSLLVRVEGLTDDYTAILASEHLAATYKDLLVKRPVIEAAAQTLGLDPRQTEEKVHVRLVPNTSIIELTVEANDPRLAMAIADGMMAAFMRISRESGSVRDSRDLIVVEPATRPLKPVESLVQPRTLKNTALAAVLGAMVAVGVAFLVEFLDDTLRWESCKDRDLLDLPVVGLMPRLPQEDGHISTDMSLESSEAEALRLLRANIFLILARRPASTILVASPGRREGRTTIVASLGMVIASGGQRVIVVDADLRTPDLHEIFGLPNDYGFCELLLGHAPSLPKALQETCIPNLNLLAAGRPPLDPALALTPPRLIELIEALTEQADIVIFDSPPVLLAPDTAILSGLVESTLLAVRDSHTTLESASRTKKRLSAYEGAPVIGVLFSRARLGRWTLRRRRRPKPRPLIAPPPAAEEGLAPLVDLASSALEAVGSERDDDSRRESGLLLIRGISSELEKEIDRVWPEGQPMSAKDEDLRGRIDMALDTLRLIGQRFGGEVAEEWYPPLDQGVEAESAEGPAVTSQAAKAGTETSRGRRSFLTPG